MSSILPVLSPSRTAAREPKASLFFLHGLGGDQQQTWTAPPDAFWPGWLAEIFPDLSVFSLGYEASPSGWLGPTMPISDRAMQLLALIEAKRLLSTPVIFVAHSLGGLVVKEMIRIADTYQNKAWETVARRTLGVVFLATPHSGSRIPDYLGALGRVLRLSISVRELEANAAPLRDLNLWYRNNARRLAVQTRVFFETQQTNGVRVVDEASADPGIEGVFPIPADANHITICKLGSKDALVFSSVVNLIRELTSSPRNRSDEIIPGSSTLTERKRYSDRSVRAFISYSHRVAEEVQLANALNRALFDEGYAAFIDTGMTIGTDWSQEIFRQIHECDFFIVLLSESSARSEMVQTEVRLAHQARREDGHPVILPIRVRFNGQLDYELESYLSRIQYTLWNGPIDTDGVITEILNAIASGGRAMQEVPTVAPTAVPASSPDPARPLASVDKRLLRTPGGVLAEDDPYYVKRPQDGVIEDMAALDRTTLVVRAPRQMGKSSLLLRYLAACRKAGKRIVHVDLQTLTGAELSTYATFLQAIAGSMLRRLRIDYDEIGRITTTATMTYFVEDVLIANSEAPLVIAVDEADRVLGTDWKHDFFSMLRAWHNRREELDSRLKGVDIALAIATDPFLLIDDPNQSPFSVGTVLDLAGFNQTQVVELNTLYASPLNPAQCNKLWELFQGQPYLTRLFLYRLRSRDAMTFEDLTARAADIDGPFGEHLRSKLLLLQRQPEVVDAFRAILRGQKLQNEILFDRLHAAGLASRERGAVTAANLVYAQFFRLL